MDQWVIYFNPTGYPGLYVARRWHIDTEPAGRIRPTTDVYTDTTLEGVRAKVPHLELFYPLARFLEDDPSIVEVWI